MTCLPPEDCLQFQQRTGHQQPQISRCPASCRVLKALPKLLRKLQDAEHGEAITTNACAAGSAQCKNFADKPWAKQCICSWGNVCLKRCKYPMYICWTLNLNHNPWRVEPGYHIFRKLIRWFRYSVKIKNLCFKYCPQGSATGPLSFLQYTCTNSPNLVV